MQITPILRPRAPEARGLWYGFLGVVAFSLTLPATRAAVNSIDPALVGVGRPAIAALLAGLLLFVTRQSIPARRYLPGLMIVALSSGVGFPVLAALALKQLPSSHGGVMIGILPMATAIIATIRAGERPSWQFWLAGGVGSAAVVGFALFQGAGHLQTGDIILFVALMAGALSYAEGGKLARSLGGVAGDKLVADP